MPPTPHLNDSALERLGGALWEFLERALAGRQPERDIPAARAIEGGILEALPVDDAGWQHGKAMIAARAVEALVGKPDSWNQAVLLTAIHFKFVHSAATHPRQTGTSRQTRGQPREMTIHLDLQNDLLAGLLASSSAVDRRVLIDSLAGFEILHALSDVISDVGLSSDEVAQLLLRIDQITGRDMARGMVLRGFLAWARRHEETARDTVERWFGQVEPAVSLGRPLIQLLVEGAVLDHSANVVWRDRVVSRLLASNEVEDWELGIQIACFAWPEVGKPSIVERHAALVAQVRRLPSKLVAVGIGALERDAADSPEEAIITAQRIIALRRTPTPETSLDDAVRMASLFQRAVWAFDTMKRRPDAVIVAIGCLLPVAPAYATHDLDGVLSDIAKVAPSDVRRFLRDWIQVHAAVLADHHTPVHEILGGMASTLGHRQVRKWVFGYMVDERPEVRRAAGAQFAGGLGRDADDRSQFEVTAADLDELSDRQVRALIHQFVGMGMRGEVWVRLMFEIALARPSTLDLALQVLRSDGVPQYPELCRRYLCLWDAPGAGDPGPPRLGEAVEALTTDLAAAEVAAQKRVTVPEILAVTPGYQPWLYAEQVALAAAHLEAEESGRFPLFSLLEKVSVIRGGGTTAPHAAGGSLPFGRIAIDFARPLRDSSDPIGARLARVVHLRAAAELVAPGVREDQ